jgi:hypothetical protein
VVKRRWILGGLALVTLSCQVIMGLEEPMGSAAVDDAGTKSDASDGSTSCKAKTLPPPPTENPSPEIKRSFWFALETFKLPVPEEGDLTGRDLDGLCSQCGAGVADGGVTCRSPKPTCDYANGIDDSLGRIVTTLKGFQDPATLANGEVEAGARTLLLYVGDWNGLANDPEVSVAFVDSEGLFSDAGCLDAGDGKRMMYESESPDPGRIPEGRKRYYPHFDGCDRWSPVGNSVTGTFPERKPAAGFQAAYVTGFTLVAPFKDVSADLFGRTTSIKLGSLVARIEPNLASSYSLDAVLTGRVAADELLIGIGLTQAHPDPNGGREYIPVCNAPVIGELAKDRICEARDLMAAKSDEFQDRPCDSISIALGFTATPALVDDFDFNTKKFVPNCGDYRCP